MMTPALIDLLERARKIEMTADDRERQRRSFAYGNTKMENDLITRDMVDQCAETLKRHASR